MSDCVNSIVILDGVLLIRAERKSGCGRNALLLDRVSRFWKGERDDELALFEICQSIYSWVCCLSAN